MPVSESSLHPYIKSLVEENGELTVTELNHLLRQVLELDADDRTILAGRTDDKFSQIVRNVVAHAPAGISCRNGYIIDKTQHPAVFCAKAVAADNAVARISAQTVAERKEKRRRFIARRTDFQSLHIQHTALGDAGESFVLEWERRRLCALNVPFNVLDEVIHTSHKYGDGAGYDILSRNGIDYALRYIEVKTTTGDMDTPFFLSENERAFMEIYRESALIYRVYNYDPGTNIGEIAILTYDTLLESYSLDPVTYKVTKSLINKGRHGSL